MKIESCRCRNPVNQAPGELNLFLTFVKSWLDSLIQDGALLLGSVEFQEADNPVSDLVQGNFEFLTEFTNPVPGKSIGNKVRWTSAGLNFLFGGGTNA